MRKIFLDTPKRTGYLEFRMQIVETSNDVGLVQQILADVRQAAGVFPDGQRFAIFEVTEFTGIQISTQCQAIVVKSEKATDEQLILDGEDICARAGRPVVVLLDDRAIAIFPREIRALA